MPSLQEHCDECQRILGKPFAEVHVWLDEFAGKPGIGMRHRHIRHHEAGIREVGVRFGVAAAQAARLHIIADLKMEGWSEADPFPRDEAHYVRMGLF